MPVRTVSTTIKVDGEKEFKKQMSSVNSELRTLRSEMSLASSEFKGQANSIEALTAKDKVLKQEYAQQQEKVRALTQAVKDSATAYGETDKRTDDYRQQLNRAKVDLNKFDEEIKQNSQYMDEAKNSSKKCATSIDEYGDKVQTAEKQTSTFSEVLKANLSSQAIIGGLRAIGNEILAVGRKVVSFAADGVKLASDLGEVQNVVDTTFGSNAESVNKFAKSAASAFGLSALSAKQYTSTMGAMLKSMGLTDKQTLDMSESIAGLSGDMASFYNLDTSEAFEKIRSGISGETEPLKQLGINLSVVNLQEFAAAKGIKEKYSAMTQSEQTLLRYQYLMKATADAQGDFAKTSDSYANQQRIMQLNIENLKAALGEKLLPTVTQVTSDFNKLVEGEISIDEFFGDVSATIDKNLPDLLNKAGELVEDIGGKILENLPELLGVASEMLEAFVKAFFTLDNLYNISKTAADLVLDLAGDILSATGENNVINALSQVGAAIVQGIWDSIKQHWHEMWYGGDNPITSTGFGRVGSGTGGGGSSGGGFGNIDGSHANGLYKVPWNGYKAELHYDEMVLPANIARTFRNASNNPSPAGASTIHHTGTIRVEGVNSQGELEAVADYVIDKMVTESRLL